LNLQAKGMMGNGRLKSNRQSQMMGSQRLLTADAVKWLRDKWQRSKRAKKCQDIDRNGASIKSII